MSLISPLSLNRSGAGGVRAIPVVAEATSAIESTVMATLSISEHLKSRVEAQAAAEGVDVESYLRWLVDGMDAGAPPDLTVNSDEELRAIVDRRLDGPWVDADAADFARIKAKFTEQLDRPAGEP